MYDIISELICVNDALQQQQLRLHNVHFATRSGPSGILLLLDYDNENCAAVTAEWLARSEKVNRSRLNDSFSSHSRELFIRCSLLGWMESTKNDQLDT